MDKKKICFIAQFPPPIHGLSKAVETLYNSNLKNEFEFEKVDITDNKRFLENLRLIKKSGADLFYFTISQTRGGNLRDLLILRALRKRKKKVLIHLHGGYYRTLVDKDMSAWQRKANYKAISYLDGAIVLGQSLRWIFEGMLPEEKIYTVPNCADDEYLMTDEEFNEKINTADQRNIKHILYLSNFIRSKGYPEVLELARLEKENVDNGKERRFHFDFAGRFFEKSEKEFFFNFIKDNKLEEYVTYHGIVTGDEKRELLRKCDYFALLTRYPNEGQPISILEAMGNGMFIITTDHAGITDIVKNNVNGIVLKKGENVSSIFDRLNIADNIPVNNRNTVLRSYSESAYLHHIRSLFLDL